MASEILTWLNEHILSIGFWLAIAGLVLYILNKDKRKAKAKEMEEKNPFMAFQQEPMKNPIQPTIYSPVLTEQQISNYSQRIEKIRKELFKAGTEYMRLKYEMADKIGHTVKNLKDIQAPYNTVVYGINSLADFFSNKNLDALEIKPQNTEMFTPEYTMKNGEAVCVKCDQAFASVEDFEKYHKGIHG